MSILCVVVLLVYFASALGIIFRREKINEHSALINYGVTYGSLVHVTALPLLTNIFTWSAMGFFVNKNTSGETAELKSRNEPSALDIFLVSAVILLSTVFLVINALIYRDYNPYSESIFNTRMFVVRIIKLGLRVSLIYQTAVLDGQSDYLVLVLASITYLYVVYIHSTTFDHHKLWLQMIVAGADACVLVVCLVAVGEWALGKSTNILYILFVVLLMISAIVLFVYRSKMDLLNCSNFNTPILDLNATKAHERLLSMLSILRSDTELDKFRLKLYLQREVKKLGRVRCKDQKDMASATINACIISQRKRKQRQLDADKENLEAILYELFVNYIELVLGSDMTHRPTIILLTYTLLLDNSRVNFCVQHYIRLIRLNSRDKEVRTHIALCSMKRQIAKHLKEAREADTKYARSNFGEFIKIEKRLHDLTAMIGENANWLYIYLAGVFFDDLNCKMGLRLRTMIYTLHQRIKEQYRKVKRTKSHRRRIDLVYYKYLTETVYDYAEARKIHLNLDAETRPFTVDIGNISSFKGVVHANMDKSYVIISANKDSFCDIIRKSPSFDKMFKKSKLAKSEKNLFSFLVPGTHDHFLQKMKSLYVAHDSAEGAKDEDVLMLNSKRECVCFAVYDLHPMLDSDNGSVVLLTLWPINLWPIDTNMIVLYDKYTLRVMHVNETFSQCFNVGKDEIEDDEKNSTYNYVITNLWPRLRDSKFIKRLEDGERLRLLMRNTIKQEGSGRRPANGSIARNDSINIQGRISQYVYLENLNFKALESSDLQGIKVSTLNAVLRKNTASKQSNLYLKRDSESIESQSANEEDTDNNAFINKVRNFELKSMFRNTVALTLISLIAALGVPILLYINFSTFRKFRFDVKTTLSLMDITSSKVEGITSNIYYMLQLLLIDTGVIRWTGPILERENIFRLYESFQLRMSSQQEQYTRLLIDQHPQLTLYNINALSTEGLEGLGKELNEIETKIYASKDYSLRDTRYTAVYNYSGNLDGFALSPSFAQLYINKSTFRSLVPSLIGAYDDLKESMDGIVKDYSTKTQRIMISVYVLVAVFSAAVMGFIYRLNSRVYHLFSLVYILSKAQLSKFMTRLDTLRDRSITSGFQSNTVDIWVRSMYEVPNEYNTFNTATMGEGEGNNFNERADRVQTYNARLLKFSRRVFLIPLAIMALLFALFMVQAKHSDSVLRKFDSRFQLLNALSDLKMNLIRLNFAYFSVFFDEECDSDCTEAAAVISDLVAGDIDSINFHILNTVKGLDGEYFDGLRGISTNYCEAYFVRTENSSEMCKENPVYYSNFAVILTKALINYKSYLKIADDPNIDQIHTLNAYMVFYVRQGIIYLLDLGVLEIHEFVSGAVRSQFWVFAILLTLIFIVSIIAMLIVKKYVTQEFLETRLIVGLLNTNIAREEDDTKEYIDNYKF